MTDSSTSLSTKHSYQTGWHAKVSSCIKAACFLLPLTLPVLSNVASAGIIIDDAFRFIRTDTYVAVGPEGTAQEIIDYGSFIVNGPASPAGGSDALGSFVSTKERSASQTNGTDSASAYAYVSVNSDLTLSNDVLDFDILVSLETEGTISGDARVVGTPRTNSTRTFSFFNHQVDFTIDANYSYVLTGQDPVHLYDFANAQWLDTSSGTGILGPGSYSFRLSEGEEIYQNNQGTQNLQSTYNTQFTVSAVAVPEASTYGLLAFSAVGVLIFLRRRSKSAKS
ncbi:MAG: hypothetical protein AB3N63_02090 [Puniceicoccaceae bacterium]